MANINARLSTICRVREVPTKKHKHNISLKRWFQNFKNVSLVLRTFFCNFTAEIKANYCWRKWESIAAKAK
jgi:hypothetical protein